MSWAVKVEHLVCPCNQVWGSVLPPPRCPYHDPQVVVTGWWVGPLEHIELADAVKAEMRAAGK